MLPKFIEKIPLQKRGDKIVDVYVYERWVEVTPDAVAKRIADINSLQHKLPELEAQKLAVEALSPQAEVVE